jgi:REDY-like protein HapK
MKYLILRYNLRDGVTHDAFEAWVRTSDHPAMRSLKRVDRFDTFRVTGLLMGDGAPSAAYYELFEISDLDTFVANDMPGATVQAIMGAFMTMVDNPEFNIAEAIDPA